VVELESQKLVVVLPNWVGDLVLATPALRALRLGFDQARITYLLRPHLEELVGGSPWHDDTLHWPARGRGNSRQTLLKLIKQLRSQRFEIAVLLANSLKSALVMSVAKIPRRVGYDRDGRGMLLTDRLLPDRYNGHFLPVSAVKYYLGIADYLGCPAAGVNLELYTEPHFEQEVDSLYIRHGLDRSAPVALINPGASYGPAKCWPAERFAEVGDALVKRFGMQVVVVCGPREKQIANAVVAAMNEKGTALTEPVIGLGTLKALVRRSKLLVTNDTGPRHLATAFDVPVVTLFGPTDPRWTETSYPRERRLQVQVDCGPCMKRHCPQKDHRCMREILPGEVIEQIADLLQATNPSTTSGQWTPSRQGEQC